MNKTVIEVQVRAVLPTSGGCAVFIGNTDKVFIIYVDQTVGRAIIRAENELQQKKIIELDARPSDCIAMATQQKAPIYVSQEVWDEVDDMSDVLRKMEEEGLKPDPETESSEED